MFGNHAVLILIAVLFAVRIALWVNFRRSQQAQRSGIVTLQYAVVIGAAVLFYKPQNGFWPILLSSLVLIVALGLLPTFKATRSR